jgi:serine/threonine-protein kinase
MPDPAVAREIEQAIVGALGRRGVSGQVVVREGTAELHGSGPVVAIELGEWVDQWALLPPDIRDRRAELAAERLKNALGRSVPPAAPAGDSSSLRRALLVAIGVAAIVGAAGWTWRMGFFGDRGARTAASGSAAETQPVVGDPTAREKEACEAARRRLYAGATAMDLEPAGWVIEIWLARDSNKSPILAEQALKDASGAKLLGRLGATQPATVQWIDTGEPTRALLRFEGGYLRPFLKAEGRDRFIALVDDLADASDADYAALFARCAHSSVRDIGAYFRGRDAAGAATALLFAEGLFTDPRAVDKNKLDAKDGALASLQRAATGLEQPAVEELIRDNGGRLSLRDPDAGRPRAGIVFALGGPIKAQQAARALAKKLRVD